MNHNPYAAPQAMPPAPGVPTAVGAPQAWDVGETLTLAWEGFKLRWGVLVGSYFVASVIAGIPGQLPGVLLLSKTVEPNSAEYWTIYAVCLFVSLVVQCFFQTGLIRIWVAVARGQDPQFGDLFGGGSRFLPMLAALLLQMVVISLGYVFLIVPGVILGLGFMFSQYYVADAGMGPIEAMKASWEATRGHKWKLFLLGLVGALVAMIGLVGCCIGIYATINILWVALAIVYVRRSGRGTATSAFAPPPYDGGYGGGSAPGVYGGPPPGGGGY